jgi:hypothetical protein
MVPSEFARLLKPGEFRPFRVHLADGREAVIPHPEFAALSPDARTLVVFDAKTSRIATIIDVFLVTSVEFETAA